jgi:hypothetical protein
MKIVDGLYKLDHTIAWQIAQVAFALGINLLIFELRVNRDQCVTLVTLFLLASLWARRRGRYVQAAPVLCRESTASAPRPG